MRPGPAWRQQREMHAIRRWEEMQLDSAESQVLELAVAVGAERLWRNRRAQAYLQARGISEGVARAQRLGYASGIDLLPALQTAGTERTSGRQFLEIAEELGLVIRRQSDTGAT